MVNTPNFKKGTGRIAVDLYDFENHVNGVNPSDQPNSWRHKASQIDVDNPSLVYGTPNTVEQALEDLNGLANLVNSAGQGFVTVGDGYDTWHIANGTINFDPSIPTLDSLLNPIFAAIVAGTGIPTQYNRIKFGGIVVIKAGTYVVANTIQVPPGITLMGEGFGTKICNITSLIIPAYGVEPSPKITPTPAPLFNVLADPNRSNHDAAVDPNEFMFSDATKFMNMVICDNFVEPPILGATFYKAPQNSSGNNPLINQNTGSNLELHNVYLLGRVNFTSGTIVSAATRYATQLTGSTSTGTHLRINNCFIDGFSQPIEYHTSGGVNDFLEINGNKIRSHGYFNGDPNVVSDNCIVSMNDNNLLMSNNILYGNHSKLTTIVYLNGQLGSAPALQSISKALLINNDFIINKGGSSTITSTPFVPADAISGTYTTRINVVFYGINHNSFRIGSTQLSLDSNFLTVKVGAIWASRLVSSNYTVDSSGPDYYLFIDNTIGSGFNITLPSASANNGRDIIIKDTGICSTFNITLVPNGSDKIEGLNSNYIMELNFQTVKLTAMNGNWWFTF